MSLTGSSGNVMGYAFVAVINRQAVGVESSKKSDVIILDPFENLDFEF
jgi:hypothetical protein